MSQFLLDIENNIKRYQLKFPLEYDELKHDWCLGYSTCHGINFTQFRLTCENFVIFNHSSNIYTNKYSLTVLDSDNVIEMTSHDQFNYFSTRNIKRSGLKIWMRPLSMVKIQQMLGIEFYSTSEIRFKLQ